MRTLTLTFDGVVSETFSRQMPQLAGIDGRVDNGLVFIMKASGAGVGVGVVSVDVAVAFGGVGVTDQVDGRLFRFTIGDSRSDALLHVTIAPRVFGHLPLAVAFTLTVGRRKEIVA